MWVSAVLMTAGGEAATARTSVDRLMRLYDLHVDRLHAVLRRMVGPGHSTDDLLHDVFEVALKKPERLDGLDDEQARGWFIGVAVRLVQNERRRVRVRQFLGLESAGDLSGDDDPALSLAQKQSREQVYRALNSLSEKQRTVFVLFELDGLSGVEIAAALDCPLKTVWSRLAQARLEFDAAVRRLAAKGPLV